MRISEILTETIEAGEVYGWIDPNGKEYDIGSYETASDDHESLIYLLADKGIIPDVIRNDERDHDALLNSVLDAGWIRIGAVDYGIAFIQMNPRTVTKRALSYLFRVMTKFKVDDITIDFEEYDEEMSSGKHFSDLRISLSYIKKATNK